MAGQGDLRHNKKRTRSSRVFIPNSSDNEANDDIIDIETSQRSTQGRRTLKEVAIPAMSSAKAPSTRGRSAATQAQQAEQTSSNGSPSLEESDYDTPNTSLSTTPATSIRHGRSATRKSALSSTFTAVVSTSSHGQAHNAILDTDDDDDDDAIDVDAEIALQIQMEDEDRERQRKRQKLEHDSDDELYPVNEPVPSSSRVRAAYKGKGKGKAELMDVDDDEDWDMSVVAPTFTGKGKGKAKAVDQTTGRGRAGRRSSAKQMFILDDDSSLDLQDSEEDEFMPDDTDSLLGELESPIASGSEDEEPLMAASARLKTETLRAPKQTKGKKRLTWEERMEQKKRLRRHAHIEDRWERKRAMNRERAEQQHPKLRTMWDDLQKIPTLEVQRAEQPQSISRRLKPFQLEGLSWMIRQEQTHYKGGLLGDEMGMGKTIQAVSLIMSDYPAKAPTLVCVPPVALMQWSNEIREYTDNKLKVLVYHGTNAKCKKMSIKELKTYDIIMVSYNSLESLYRKETKGWSRGEDIIKEASPLHAITYHRLILDEAHSIKSRNTGVAKACFALKGTYKWCLSGTPVQNRIGEFFSLLRFLEVRPFADYFCRSCDCEKLHWATDDDHMCVACNHGASEHISVFNQELLNPITGDDAELREEALTKLHMITARVMLRRMKRDHTNSMVS